MGIGNINKSKVLLSRPKTGDNRYLTITQIK